MAFLTDLQSIRQQAKDRYNAHKIKSATLIYAATVDVMNDNIDLLKYAPKKESISDQIKCSHSMHTKCINCISRNLLPFDQKQTSQKHGLFNIIFSNQCNSENIKKLIKISRSSQPNSMKHFQPKKSLQYGEILFFSFAHILTKVKSFSVNINYENCIFIDFGSGISKTLFIAALFHKFKQCVGIEIIHKIHQKAVAYKQKIQNKHYKFFECSPDKIHLIHGDIFDQSMLQRNCFSNQQMNNSDYIIFIASTAFTDKMMQNLSNTLLAILSSKSSQHKIWIITLSQPLPNKDAFKVIHNELYRMSWGNVMVYFQHYLST